MRLKLSSAKNMILFLLLVASVLFSSGCANKGYWASRTNDLGDIFTATVGEGCGARMRVGPLHAGLLYNRDLVGLRGGTFAKGTRDTPNAPDLPGQVGDLDIEYIFPIYGKTGEKVSSFESFLPGTGLTQWRNKEYFASGKFPFITTKFEPTGHPRNYLFNPYFSNIEVTAGFVVTFKLGFNPGELIDFVLGWTTLDIFDDDM